MTPAYIRIEGLGSALALLGLYGLALLVALVVALILIRRGRWRWGATLLLALVALMFGPNLWSEQRRAAAEARMLALSYWPEAVTLEGQTILFVAVGGERCGSLCDATAAQHPSAQVFSAHLRPSFDQRGALSDVDRELRLLSRVEVISREFGVQTGLRQVETMPLPDLVFVVDNLGWFSQTHPTMVGLSPEDAAEVGGAVYLFDGTAWVVGDLPEARMVLAIMDYSPPVLWFAREQRRAPPTAVFNSVLADWVCGETPPGPDCPAYF